MNPITLLDGSGKDSLDFSSSTVDLTVSLAISTQQTVAPGVRLQISPTEFENLYGGVGNDALSGNQRHNTIPGNAGDDTLVGNSVTSVLRGHSGDDILDGARASDSLVGGIGDDV